VLFFQVMLTGGYAYAHELVRRLEGRAALAVHSVLLVLCLGAMLVCGALWPSPITPGPGLRPAAPDAPVPGLIATLLLAVGLPFFLLSANSPLMQSIYSRAYPQRSYTRLYALSNLGSLAGLLAYPLLVEPALSLRSQGWLWSAAFLGFGGLTLWIWWRYGSAPRPRPGDEGPPAAAARPAMWLTLSATASVFLLAVTNHITQEIAAVPLLWTMPLAAYLLSLIMAFSGPRAYDRRLYAMLFALVSLGSVVASLDPGAVSAGVQIAVFVVLLLVGGMICHGELYALRPPASDLTGFYLTASVGGALGGAFVIVLAPALFSGYWELHLAWIMTAVILGLSGWSRLRQRPGAQAAVIVTAAILTTLGLAAGLNRSPGDLFRQRDFYGALRISRIETESGRAAYALIHGTTVHGVQYIDEASRGLYTTYFVEDSGVGLALRAQQARVPRLRAGVLGLGAGTLAAYGRSGDEYFFYELNPVVIELARGQGGYFSFLADSRAGITIIPGDARLSLERQLRLDRDGMDFDVLVLDVFSSDSIPVHLLTREAVELYLKHLDSNGILAAHVSSRYLDLESVVRRLARELGLSVVRIDRPIRVGEDAIASQWLLLARDPQLLPVPPQGDPAALSEARPWTDDYSSVLEALRW
jgi:spermidine synthase